MNAQQVPQCKHLIKKKKKKKKRSNIGSCPQVPVEFDSKSICSKYNEMYKSHVLPVLLHR